MGAALCLPVWTAFMLIGSLLWAFYRLSGQALPAAVTRPDQVFPYYMVTQMPVGVAGLFLAGLFGAAMSMLASDLNCLGLILVEDFYSHFFPLPHRCAASALRQAGRHRLRRSRHRGRSSAQLNARLRPRALLHRRLHRCRRLGRPLSARISLAASRPHCAIAGIVVNLLFTVYATLTLDGGKILNLHRYNYPWSEYTIGAFGNLLLLAVGLLCAALFPCAAQLSLPPAHSGAGLPSRKRPSLHAVQLGETP